MIRLISQHLRSKTHLGTTISCICDSAFPTISALFLHLEGNYCDKINRHTFIHIINLDIETGNLDINAQTGDLFANSEDALQVAFDECVINSLDGNGYECMTCSRYFKHENALWNHLNNSEKWAFDDYSCTSCDREFSYPSGLMQHVESRSCRD